MSTDLTRIREKARKQPGLVFTSLYHHVTDLDNLRSCYEALDGDKAVGVDGVTKEQYGEGLEENLQCLSDRLPDSPTSPMRSPGLSVKLMPFRAVRSPARNRNLTTRSCTSSVIHLKMEERLLACDKDPARACNGGDLAGGNPNKS